jgi:hypothetical protein
MGNCFLERLYPGAMNERAGEIADHLHKAALAATRGYELAYEALGEAFKDCIALPQMPQTR